MVEPKSGSIISKRAPDDPVNTIYTNLVDKSADLKNLDERISGLQDERMDSTEMLTEYIHPNEQYYTSAERHIQSISDTVLRTAILRIMNESKDRFDASMKSTKNLLNSIDSTIKQIDNQRELLKVLMTIPVIQEYQRLNTPSSKSSKDLEAELNILKRKFDSIIKKNGG